MYKAIISELKSCHQVKAAAFDDLPKRLQEAYEKGVQDGKASVENFYNMQIVEYRNELATLHTDLSKSITSQIEEIEKSFLKELPKIILTVIKKVWSYLEWDATSVKSMVENALAEYHTGEGDLEVYLSASDLALFQEMKVELQYPGILFKEDLNLKRGDCWIKSRFGILDHRLETKLKPLEEHLQVELN